MIKMYQVLKLPAVFCFTIKYIFFKSVFKGWILFKHTHIECVYVCSCTCYALRANVAGPHSFKRSIRGLLLSLRLEPG